MATNKFLLSAKIAGVLFLLCFFVVSAHAQFLRTSYFMEGVTYRMQLNPALTPTRGYFNLPAIGALNVSASSNSLGTQDIFDVIDSDEDFFNNNDFYNRLSDQNRLNVNVNTDILSFGWYKGKNFWSFNVGARVDVGAEVPRSMFDFMRAMNKEEGITSLSDLNHSIEKEKLEINAYAEVGIGYARAINDRLTVGGKVKLLLGAGNLKLDVNKIGISATQGNGNIMDPNTWQNSSASIDVDARLESSFKGMDLTENDNGFIDEFDFNGFGIAGYGGAIDLGASYRILNNLTVSAAVLDLGFMSWSKGSTKVATAQQSRKYDANNYQEFLDIVQDGEVLNYDLLGLKVDENEAKSRSTSLHSTLVFGAEYALLNNWLVVGALSTTRFTKPKTLSEITLSANIRPKSWFNVAASYSMIQSAGKSFGLAVKLGPLFVGTDYMFLGENSKSVNAFLGISIPLNKRKKSTSI